MPYVKVAIVGDGSAQDPFRPDIDEPGWFCIMPVDEKGVPTVSETVAFIQREQQAAKGTLIDEAEVVAEAKKVDPRLTDEQIGSWRRLKIGQLDGNNKRELQHNRL